MTPFALDMTRQSGISVTLSNICLLSSISETISRSKNLTTKAIRHYDTVSVTTERFFAMPMSAFRCVSVLLFYPRVFFVA